MVETKILNSKGKPILLNDHEERIAKVNQRRVNDLGYDIDITTLTAITKKVTEQKFFEISPADYLPVVVGNGAWSSQLLTYRSFALADDFSTGVINTGGNNGRLAAADAGVDSVPVAILNWAKSIGWSLFDLQQAAKAGNWDLVTAKEESRKMNWDLGIQRTAFLGLSGNTNCLGLFTQSGVTTNTSFISGPISQMATVDFKYFCAGIVNLYRANCNRSAWPTHFILPESDYLGLAAASSPDFPVKTTLQLLEEMFQTICRNKNFKVLPNAYADPAQSGQTTLLYTLLNYDDKSVRMDVPVPYSNTLANSIDNFSFQNVGYGQFTGVQTYRPLEMYYLTCPQPN